MLSGRAPGRACGRSRTRVARGLPTWRKYEIPGELRITDEGGRMTSESRVMSDVVSFFLIVVDEDRKQFAVEGPLTDHKPWSRAIAAAQGEGRKIRCCNISEKTRTDTIAMWRRHYGHFYRFVESGSALLSS
jgi:hypothetical protein